MVRKRSLLLLLCAQLATSLPVLAEPATAGVAAEAERLFERGLKEMQNHDYQSGCPRLAESYQLDPSPGALFTLAECESGWEKSASALAHYQSFIAQLPTMTRERRATFEERRRIATGQIAALSASAPKLTLSVASDQPPALVVKTDGIVVPPGTYGVARQLDPGAYAVTAELDGKIVWKRSITLEAGNQATLEIAPPLRGAGQPGAAQSSSRTRVPVYIAGGVAVAGLTTGLVAGLVAYQQKSTIDSHCPARTCDTQGRNALDSARTEARIGTLGISVGLAGAATAAALLLFSNSEAASVAKPVAGKRRWAVASDGRSLSLVGQF